MIYVTGDIRRIAEIYLSNGSILAHEDKVAL